MLENQTCKTNIWPVLDNDNRTFLSCKRSDHTSLQCCYITNLSVIFFHIWMQCTKPQVKILRFLQCCYCNAVVGAEMVIQALQLTVEQMEWTMDGPSARYEPINVPHISKTLRNYKPLWVLKREQSWPLIAISSQKMTFSTKFVHIFWEQDTYGACTHMLDAQMSMHVV